MNEDQFKRLRKEVEDARTEADRAQGALDQLMSRLKEEFDCSDLKSAKKLLEELRAKKERAAAAFDKAARDYEKKWKGQ